MILLKNLSINILPSFQKKHVSLKQFLLSTTKYLIFYRGLKIWNYFLTNEEKEIQSHSLLL